jgi:formylglycine-generating enzyme required for sulfatase activity
MITVRGGCIDKHEVLVSDFVACAADKRCAPAVAEDTIAGPNVTDEEHALFDPLCNAHAAVDNADHPMNCVDLAGAEAFCRAHGKRLPTGAEWERAARGVAGGRYPWGTSSPVSTLVNACGAECVAWKKAHKDLVTKIRGMSLTAEAFPGDDGYAATSPAGAFAMGASSVGAVDMAGNVEEWMQGGEVRGGSWLSARDAELRVDAHRALDPSTRSATVGFRCAK